MPINSDAGSKSEELGNTKGEDERDIVRESRMQKDEAAVKSSMSEEKDNEEEARTSPEEDGDEEMGSFIRVRSQTDGIFEQEDEDDEEDEFYDYTIPEVEIRSPPPPRKRKQDISLIDNELTDVIELPDDEEQMYTDNEPAYTMDTDMFQSRKRDRLPLYLLNPDDYTHDPKKQIQIRRAIITYRHHQDKKEQIIKLTEENKKLREYTALLRAKVVELSRCGCEKNQTTNLEVLDVVIPPVPPRMYVRGNRPVLAVPYNKCPLSPTSFAKSSAETCKIEGETSSKLSRPCTSSSVQGAALPPLSKPTTFDPSKPLINITSSRLAALNCKTITTNNLTPILPKPQVSKPYNNGTPTASSLVRATRSATTQAQKGFQMGNNMNRVSISGMTPNRQGFIPISLAASVKSEPGVSSASIMNSAKVSSSTSTSSIMNANVKIETTTPATATPASRIVFAKKGNTTNAVQTASQLLFGTRAIPQGTSPVTRPAFEASPSLTASQLAFANRTPKPSTITNPLTPVNNTTRLPSQANQIFRTASGQVLKLVQTPAQLARKMPNAIGRGSAQRFQPIVPKPAPALKPIDSLDAEAISRQINRQQLEEMWKNFDEEEEDEMAIIAAINGTSPPQRTRKQTMGNSTKLQQDRPKRKSNGILKSLEGEIELNKYEDIVFEEAD